MKTIKRILSILLLTVITASFCLIGYSCQKDDITIPDEIKKPGTEYEVEETNYNFIENGKTDYKIVVSTSPTEREKYAVQELTYFLQDTCSVNIPVIDDLSAEYNENNKYIVVGHNRLFEKSGIKIDGFLGNSGFKIISKGKMVFLAGKIGQPGPINAVYKFLEYMIKLKIYSVDCWTYDVSSTVPMLEFSVVDYPHFDWRRIGNYHQSHPRMRFSFEDSNYVGGTHSHFYILPPEIYNNPEVSDTYHPEWYTGALNQAKTELRLMNEEMTVEYARRCMDIIRSVPDMAYLSIGPNDSMSVYPGKTDLEIAAAPPYNTNAGGMYIIFVNRVAKLIEEWMAEEMPERPPLKIRAAFYNYNLNPPVTMKVNQDGSVSYQPHSQYVIPRSNVDIFFIAAYMNSYNVPIIDTQNSAIKNALEGWASFGNPVSVYTYGLCFTDGGHMVNFNDFGSIVANFRYGQQIGVRGWTIETSYSGITSSFDELREYVYSRLMWDVNLDYNEVAYEFIDAFYGAAAANMKEYYDLTVSNNIVNTTLKDLPGGIYGTITESKYYPFELTYKMYELISGAEEALEPLRTQNYAQYVQLLNRVRIQKMTPQYLILRHYPNMFGKSELMAMIDEYEVTAAGNNVAGPDAYGKHADIIQTWRQRVSNM